MSLKSVATRSFAALLTCGALFSVVAAAQADPRVLFGKDAAIESLRQFTDVRDVAFSPDGKTIFVLNGNRVVAFNVDTQNTQNIIGGGTDFFLGDARLTQLSNPQEIALAPDGKTLYIVESGNRRVLVVDLATKQAKVFFGEGDGLARGRDVFGGLVPGHIAVSPTGNNVYVSAHGNNPESVRVVDVVIDSNQVLPFVGGGQLFDHLEGRLATEVRLPLAAPIAVSADGQTVFISGTRNLLAVGVTSRTVNPIPSGPGGSSNDFIVTAAAAPTGDTCLFVNGHLNHVLQGCATDPHEAVIVASVWGEEDGLSPATAVRLSPVTAEAGRRPGRTPKKVTVAPDGSLLVRTVSSGPNNTNIVELLLVGGGDEFEAMLQRLVDIDVTDDFKYNASVDHLKVLARPAINTVRQINQRTNGAGKLKCPGARALPAEVVELISEWVDVAYAPGEARAQSFRRLRAKLALHELRAARAAKL